MNTFDSRSSEGDSFNRNESDIDEFIHQVNSDYYVVKVGSQDLFQSYCLPGLAFIEPLTVGIWDTSVFYAFVSLGTFHAHVQDAVPPCDTLLNSQSKLATHIYCAFISLISLFLTYSP